MVYSGGDDLFMIGHWLDITEAASDIRRYFLKYTGNPFMTISGGIAVNEEKYPVYQYARDAEEGEKKAKRYKDAITLFGTKSFPWSDVEKIGERVKLFCRYLKTDGSCMVIDEGKLPKTFFYRLHALQCRRLWSMNLLMGFYNAHCLFLAPYFCSMIRHTFCRVPLMILWFHLNLKETWAKN